MGNRLDTADRNGEREALLAVSSLLQRCDAGPGGRSQGWQKYDDNCHCCQRANVEGRDMKTSAYWMRKGHAPSSFSIFAAAIFTLIQASLAAPPENSAPSLKPPPPI